MEESHDNLMNYNDIFHSKVHQDMLSVHHNHTSILRQYVAIFFTKNDKTNLLRVPSNRASYHTVKGLNVTPQKILSRLWKHRMKDVTVLDGEWD